MTVAVIGASGLVGRAAVAALASRDEVRAHVRRPDAAEPLRALGAKVAVASLEDEAAVEALLGGAFTVVHLAGGANEPNDEAYAEANLRSVERVLKVASRAGVRRVALLSVPRAEPDAGDPYLRAKGLAERAVAASGLEHAIVRSAHVYGLGGFWFTAAVQAAAQDPPEVVGPGTQQIAPVFADDVAEVLGAIDDRSDPVAGLWGLQGPDRVSADEFAALVGEGRGEIVHLSAEAAQDRLSELLGGPVSAAACRLLAADSTADAPDAAAEFAVPLRSLAEGLEATMRASAAGLEG
jgi:uncharacterized protein YbjT (DUF2867 family)